MKAEKYRRHASVYGNQSGMVLALTLTFIAILTLLGATAVTMISTDMLLGGNVKNSQIAFDQAEAGIHYTLGRLPALIRQGTLSLNGEQKTEDYDFATPSGFTFRLDSHATFTRVANIHKYFFQVTGRPSPNSPFQSTLEVVIQRQSFLPYGIFGDERVDLPTAGKIYSYDASMTPVPASGHSTGRADVGSHGVISAHSNRSPLDVDGTVALSTSIDGAVFTFRHTSEVIDHLPATVPVGGGKALALSDAPHINSDPLNANALVDRAESDYIASNNNTDIATISGNTINQTTTLTAGNYYLEEIALDSGDTLTIDTHAGDVNIYVQSIDITHTAHLDIDTSGGGKVNIYLDGKGVIGSPQHLLWPTLSIDGPPANFWLVSRSDEPLTLYHHGDFKGFIYAPFARVTLSSFSLKAYGLLWGKAIDIRADSGPFTFYVDTSMQNLFLSNDVTLLSWKELRN